MNRPALELQQRLSLDDFEDLLADAPEDWSAFRIADGLAASLALPYVGIDIPLAEIYEDVFA